VPAVRQKLHLASCADLRSQLLSAERKAKLDGIAFIWGARETQWEEGFSYLNKFSVQKGHCHVAATYKTEDGYRLGQWIRAQRTNKSTMDPDLQQRLEALPGWVWKVRK
jgi:Helicase associated domain